MATKSKDGIVSELTAEEQTVFDDNRAINSTAKAEDIAMLEAQETNKASAKAKLIAGEALTEAEADTIVI